MLNQLVQNFRQNWRSGVTVSLVSIPLSVSLAVASQASPVMGIITAVWAGLMASIFGGSNYNIVGPTGALSGILAAYALTHGMGSLPALAVITGIYVLIAYIFKLERFLIFVPASAIHGFTLGVAFIIAFNQMNFALGINGLEKHEHFIDNVIESFKNISLTSVASAGIFLFFLVGLFGFLKFLPKLPGAIILAPLGIGLGYLSHEGVVPFHLDTLGDKFQNISPQLFIVPELFFDNSLIFAGLTVALVAILETMISAKIADGMTKTKHDKRKEMLGLGLANIASGLAGGLPATAALARTALNVKTGATDKLSATISSVCIVIISLIFLGYFSFIPLAVIAAILVFVAIRMIELHHLKNLYRHDKKNFIVAFFVAFITIYEDPIIGIAVGTAISLIIFVEKLSHGHFELVGSNKSVVHHISDDEVLASSPDADVLVYSIKGQLAYINSQSHIARFENNLKEYNSIVLRLRDLHFIDTDGVDALDEIIDIIHSKGKQVLICRVNTHIKDLLGESENYKTLKKEGLIFHSTEEALKYLKVKPLSV